MSNRQSAAKTLNRNIWVKFRDYRNHIFIWKRVEYTIISGKGREFYLTVHKYIVYLCIVKIYLIMENIPLGFVYYLQNPNTGEIFYVGATQISLKNRLRTHYQHLLEMKKGQRKSNKRYEYLLNLQPVKATIHLLEVVTDGDLFERERFYINKFREINPNLTNMTNGGQGQFTTEYYSEEQKLETGQKISLKLKGVKKPKGFAQHLSDIRQGLDNPNSKEISIGWIVADEKYLFKYGFEVNNFVGKKDAYGNVFKYFKHQRTGKPYGYKWELFSKLNKEIQDIVQSSYENKE